MKNEEIPDSYQEYLETILRITYKTNKESVKTSEIAKKLNVKAPSVTEMLDKLKKKDLINYQKRKGVTLTEKGRKVGERLLTNHRIIEYFLKFFLGIEEYHEIACKLEHHFNEEMTEKMLQLMGNPEIKLESDPIPELINTIQVPLLLLKSKVIDDIKVSDDKIKKIIQAEKQKLIENL